MGKYCLTGILLVLVGVALEVQAQKVENDTIVHEIVSIGKVNPNAPKLSPAELEKKWKREEREMMRKYKQDSIKYVKQIERQLKPTEDSIIRLLKAGKSIEESGLPQYVAKEGMVKGFFVNRFVDNRVYKTVRKLPEQIVGVAKCYYQYEEDNYSRLFHINDTVRAFKYIRKAIETDPSCASAYVAAADILAYQGEENVALEWLNAGKKANPSEASLYKASTDVLFRIAQTQLIEYRAEGKYTDYLTLYQPAVDQQKKLKEKDPNYPLDLELARLYYKMYDKGGVMPLQQIAEHYGNVDRKVLNKGDLGAYSMALFYTNQVKPLVDVTEYALKTYSDDHGLNMYHFYGKLRVAQYEKDNEKSVQLFKEAIAAADKFFAIADKTKLQVIDNLRYGEAFNGAKHYDRAIEIYNDILKTPNLEEKDKNTIYRHIASSVEGKANDYIKDGNYVNAVNIYSDFVEQCKSIGRYEAFMPNMLANIYKSWAKSLEGQEQLDKYNKAEEIYEKMEKQFPEFDYIAILNRIDIRQQANPQWVEAPYSYVPALADDLIETILSKDNLTASLKTRLLTGYWILCYYNAINASNKNGDKKKAIDYAHKVTAIDPSHTGANRILEIFEKRK